MKSDIKTAAIIQARMSSKRFPGKVMSILGNKSMLEFQIDRIKSCEDIDEIIIATTNNKSDNIIEELAIKIYLLRSLEDMKKMYFRDMFRPQN